MEHARNIGIPSQILSALLEQAAKMADARD
jgi:hypothetical protein